MTSVTLWGLKACDTCRKAEKALKASGLHTTFVDVRKEPLSAAEIQKFLTEFNKDLINTRSTTWRALSDEMRKKPAEELLAEHPALMKRPVLEKDGTLFLGWSADIQAKVLPG